MSKQEPEEPEIVIFEEEEFFPIKKFTLITKRFTVSQLTNPVVLTEIVEATKNFYKNLSNPRKGVRKITAHHFKIAIGKTHLLDEEIAQEIKTALHSQDLSPAVRSQLWNVCSKKLQYMMLKTSQEAFDYELYELMELDPIYISRAFLSLNSLGTPRKTGYSTTYMHLDYETGEKLVHYLCNLPDQDIREFLRIIDPRVMYLIATEEIKKYLDDYGYYPDFFKKLFLALDPIYDDMVPPDLFFLHWLQDKDPEMFDSLVFELNNQKYDEFRDMFYDNRRRFGDKFDAEDGQDNVDKQNPDEYLDSLLS